MAASSPGLKSETLILSKAGTPPYGPAQGASSGLVVDMGGPRMFAAAAASNTDSSMPPHKLAAHARYSRLFSTGVSTRARAAAVRIGLRPQVDAGAHGLRGEDRQR